MTKASAGLTGECPKGCHPKGGGYISFGKVIFLIRRQLLGTVTK